MQDHQWFYNKNFYPSLILATSFKKNNKHLKKEVTEYRSEIERGVSVDKVFNTKPQGNGWWLALRPAGNN